MPGTGNAKYTSVSSIPLARIFSLLRRSLLRRFTDRSMCPAVSPSRSLPQSLTPRHPHPRRISGPAARLETPRNKFTPSCRHPSSSPPIERRFDQRRWPTFAEASTYIHCHYESAHVARSVSFFLRASVLVPRRLLSLCACVCVCVYARGG